MVSYAPKNASCPCDAVHCMPGVTCAQDPRADQNFPGGFQLNVDHPSPPELINQHVGCIEHACRVGRSECDEVKHQGAGDPAESPLHEGGGNAVEKHEQADDDAKASSAWRLDVIAPFVDQPVDRADEAMQQPHDHGLNMHPARGVEVARVSNSIKLPIQPNFRACAVQVRNAADA